MLRGGHSGGHNHRGCDCNKPNSESPAGPEQLQELQAALRKRFPQAIINTTAPARPSGEWLLDMEHEGVHYVIGWTAPDRFTLSLASESSPYGEGPDGFFTNISGVLGQLEETHDRDAE